MPELTIQEIEDVIVRTEVADMSENGDRIWVRRMAEALHAKQFSIPVPEPLVLLHFAVGQYGFPNLFISAPGALILSVDDNSPDDRVFRMVTRPIPAELLASIKDSPIGEAGDDPEKDARAKQAITYMNGGKPILTVVPGGEQ